MQRANVLIRSFLAADNGSCLALFDQNCPEYFDPGERADYAAFLESRPAGYELCLLDGHCVGAFGVCERAEGGVALRWILIAPAAQGQGVGTTMMARALEHCRARGVPVLHIAASQKSAPFFARFGARTVKRIPQGWGPQLDRIEMELDCL
jgi:GNAT superfamily N-acetyltransferase